MWAGVRSVAAWLRERGVQAGDRVAVALPPSAANLVVLFGTMAAGAVAAPVNTSLRRHELHEYLGRIEPRLAIVGTDQIDLDRPGAGRVRRGGAQGRERQRSAIGADAH